MKSPEYNESREHRINQKTRNDVLQCMGVYLEDDQINKFHKYQCDPEFSEYGDEELAWIVMTPFQREAFKRKIDEERMDVDF